MKLNRVSILLKSPNSKITIFLSIVYLTKYSYAVKDYSNEKKVINQHTHDAARCNFKLSNA